MLEKLAEQIIKFRDERNWQQYNNPKDLAISISLEAAELLEIFQWSLNKTEIPEKRGRIAEELADIFIYCILMADALNFDIDTIIKEKMEMNAQKYPVKKAYGRKEKYSELEES